MFSFKTLPLRPSGPGAELSLIRDRLDTISPSLGVIGAHSGIDLKILSLNAKVLLVKTTKEYF